MVCNICGGRGKILKRVGGTGSWIPCPKCTSPVSEAKTLTELDKLMPEERPLISKLNIPDAYISIRYDSTLVFKTDALNYYSAQSLNNMATICDAIYNSVVNSLLYKQSVYLHFPIHVDGAAWVYSLQRLAVTKGISTLPYISLNILNDKIMNSSNQFEYNEDTYDDYRNTQLCILNATAHTLADSWATLADLLQERALRNLPTIVTGYWSEQALAKNKTGGASYLLDTMANRLDILKPYSIYFKGKNDIKYSKQDVQKLAVGGIEDTDEGVETVLELIGE